MTKLSDYLNTELRRRQWSMRELARRAGVSASQVSDVVGERTKPGADFCIAVAKALGDPPDYLLRLAGILPSLPDRNEEHWLWRVWTALEEMTPEEREEVIAYAYWKRSQEIEGE